MSDTVDSYLAHYGLDVPPELKHYGVKGQKWGVRKEDELVGRQTSKKTVDPKMVRAYSEDVARIRKELKKRGHGELDSALLKAKYETPVGEEPSKGLSKGQKVAIGVGIGVVGAAVLGYAAYKGGAFDSGSPINKAITATKDKFDYDTLAKRYKETPGAYSLFDTRTKAYGDAADGLKINWENGVKLSGGSLLKRVSSVAETEVRAGGFFASFRDEDVKSYSAILPSFWPGWRVGVPMDGGFINHYQAASEVRAPSGKQTVEIFRKLIGSDSDFGRAVGLNGEVVKQLSDFELGDTLKSYALSWIDNDSPTTQKFFSALKENGFNAVIDFNDAGTLGKTPLRIIDSTIFSIVKNETLSFETMVQAAAEWAPELIHFFKQVSGADVYFAHLGIEVDEKLKLPLKKDSRKDVLVALGFSYFATRDKADSKIGDSVEETAPSS